MTGFSPKKRTYLSARVKRNGRDLAAEGIKFAQRRALLSAAPILDADYAVKALGTALGGNGNGNGKGKDSRKRTAGGGVDEIEKEVRFDPNTKRQPGQVFKLHVTPQDLENPETNWGWIDPPEKSTPEEVKEGMQAALDWKRKQPKIRVRQYDQNPRTGQPILESESGIEVKSLGATVGDILPDGSNLGGRAASGIGLIVDALGKFRCPPGTPAANQFTDSMGSNCFSPTAVMRQATGGLASWFNRRLQRGVQVGLEDRGIDYSDAGIARLQAQTEAANNIGDAVSIAASAVERTDAIQRVMDKFGITSGSEMNQDMWETLDALAADAASDFEWKGLFTDIYGEELWDSDLSVRDNLEKRQARLTENFIEFSSGDKEGREAFRDALRQGDPTVTEMMDTFLTRHDAATRGQIGAFLHSFDADPESMKFVKEVKFRPYIEANEANHGGYAGYWSTRGECVPIWGGEDKRGFGVSLQFNPTAQALEPYMEGLTHGDAAKRGGKLTLIDTVGDATESAKWQAINDFMQDQANLERFMDTEALDLSAAIAGGVEGAAAHVGYHEIAHVKQYAQMQNMVVDAFDADGHFRVVDGGGQMHAFSHPPEEWTNGEWMAAVNTVFQDLARENGQTTFPPFGVEQFEGSMMHILAGSMYQRELERVGLGGATLDDLVEAGTQLPPAQKAQLNLMLMEGMAELAALEKMGIVKGDKVREALEWMDDPKPQAIGSIDSLNVRFLPTPMDQQTDLGEPPWAPGDTGMEITPSGLVLPRNPKSPVGRQERAKPHVADVAPESPDWWTETDDVADMSWAEYDAFKATQGMRSYGRLLEGRDWDAEPDAVSEPEVDTRVVGTGFGERMPTREELRSMSGPEFKEWLSDERAKVGITDPTNPAYPHPALTNRHHFRDTELVSTDFFDDLPGKETGLAGVVPETRRAALDEIKADIGREGMKDAVNIHYNPETGDVNLGDGDMRVAAAKELGMKNIPTRVTHSSIDRSDAADRKTVATRGVSGRTGKPSDIGISTTKMGPDSEKMRLSQMMYGGSSEHGNAGGMRSASFATSASAAGFGLSDNRDWGPGQLDPKKRSKLPRKDRKRYKGLEGNHGVAQQRLDDALQDYRDVGDMPWGEGPGLDGGRAGMNNPNSGWWDNADNVAKMAALDEAQEEINEAQAGLDSIKDEMHGIDNSTFRFDWAYQQRKKEGLSGGDETASGMRSQREPQLVLPHAEVGVESMTPGQRRQQLDAMDIEIPAARAKAQQSRDNAKRYSDALTYFRTNGADGKPRNRHKPSLIGDDEGRPSPPSPSSSHTVLAAFKRREEEWLAEKIQEFENSVQRWDTMDHQWSLQQRALQDHDARGEVAAASGMRSQGGTPGLSTPLEERVTDAKSGRLRDSEDRAFGEELMNMPDAEWEDQLTELERTHNADPGFLNDAEYGRMTELRERQVTEHRAYEEEEGLWDAPGDMSEDALEKRIDDLKFYRGEDGEVRDEYANRTYPQITPEEAEQLVALEAESERRDQEWLAQEAVEAAEELESRAEDASLGLDAVGDMDEDELGSAIEDLEEAKRRGDKLVPEEKAFLEKMQDEVTSLEDARMERDDARIDAQRDPIGMKEVDIEKEIDDIWSNKVDGVSDDIDERRLEVLNEYQRRTQWDMDPKELADTELLEEIAELNSRGTNLDDIDRDRLSKLENESQKYKRKMNRRVSGRPETREEMNARLEYGGNSAAARMVREDALRASRGELSIDESYRAMVRSLDQYTGMRSSKVYPTRTKVGPQLQDPAKGTDWTLTHRLEPTGKKFNPDSRGHWVQTADSGTSLYFKPYDKQTKKEIDQLLKRKQWLRTSRGDNGPIDQELHDIKERLDEIGSNKLMRRELTPGGMRSRRGADRQRRMKKAKKDFKKGFKAFGGDKAMEDLLDGVGDLFSDEEPVDEIDQLIDGMLKGIGKVLQGPPKKGGKKKRASGMRSQRDFSKEMTQRRKWEAAQKTSDVFHDRTGQMLGKAREARIKEIEKLQSGFDGKIRSTLLDLEKARGDGNQADIKKYTDKLDDINTLLQPLRQERRTLRKERDSRTRGRGMRSIKTTRTSNNPHVKKAMRQRNVDVGQNTGNAFNAPDGWTAPADLPVAMSRNLPPVQSRADALSDHRQKLDSALGDLRTAADMNSIAGPGKAELFADPVVQKFMSTRSDEDVMATIEKAAVVWHRGFDRRARVTVDDDELNDLFSSGSHMRAHTPGDAASDMRAAYDLRNGISLEAGAEARPVSGHLYHATHDDVVDNHLQNLAGPTVERSADHWDPEGKAPWGDPRSLGGDIELVLRPEASDRTHYGFGDGMSRGAIPVPMNSNDPADILAAQTPSRRNGEEEGVFQQTNRMHNLLRAGITGDYKGFENDDLRHLGGEDSNFLEPSEEALRGIEHHGAQIMGGVETDDIEFVRYPISKTNWNTRQLSNDDLGLDESATTKLVDAGFTESEIDFFYRSIRNGEVSGLRNVGWLRQALAAEETKARFDRIGVGVKFTNADGVDVLDTDTFLSGVSKLGVEGITSTDILKKRIPLEIVARAEELLVDLRRQMRPSRNNPAGVLV